MYQAGSLIRPAFANTCLIVSFFFMMITGCIVKPSVGEIKEQVFPVLFAVGIADRFRVP